MPSNTATKISTIFRDRVITELIYLLISAVMVSMMFRRLIWIHFFYHFLAIRLYHEFLFQLNCHFDIAFFELIYNNSSKTSQWNIRKFYLPTLKHLVIQLAKLQIYTLNLTTTFWHCKKKSHYFWTGVNNQSTSWLFKVWIFLLIYTSYFVLYISFFYILFFHFLYL